MLIYISHLRNRYRIARNIAASDVMSEMSKHLNDVIEMHIYTSMHTPTLCVRGDDATLKNRQVRKTRVGVACATWSFMTRDVTG